MRLTAAIFLLSLAGSVVISNRGRSVGPAKSRTNQAAATSHAYVGFDRNDYPGDGSLAALKQTFSFAGYWLNDPPGATSNTWAGKRAILNRRGFGFLVLFNGRTDGELRSPHRPAALGAGDAQAAVDRASREGFSKAAIIFLDQEEGGRLLPEQTAYLFAWVDGVISAGFRAGVYCSGIPASEGPGESMATANDIHDHAGERDITYFVYNDGCPPAPGCWLPEPPPQPSASGVPFASIWQFAQSPRRHEFTARCSSSYARDGNCYAPVATGNGSIFLDLDSATSPDPSNGR